jgi:hypothetical protein
LISHLLEVEEVAASILAEATGCAVVAPAKKAKSAMRFAWSYTVLQISEYGYLLLPVRGRDVPRSAVARACNANEKKLNFVTLRKWESEMKGNSYTHTHYPRRQTATDSYRHARDTPHALRRA